MTTILVVDDSLTVRMDLAEALEAAGFATALCATAAAARQALATGTIALAILDVRLPDGDGVELLRELRAMPQLAELPVLMLSSEADVVDRVRGLKMGANDYVGKPYDTALVIARVRELVPLPAAEARPVLVIDDSPTFRQAIADRLGSAGYAVIVAASGTEGLRQAATVRPSAIIVDGVMPDMRGEVVIRRLRLDPALRATPCLMLTGSDEADAEIDALDAGADAFARKDADLEIILARFTAMLRATHDVLEGASTLGPKRVLAIDHSAAYVAALSALLHEDGYDVVTASSGEQALELLAIQRVDCVLVELAMSGLSGREICRRMKAVPLLSDIPIIALSATDDRDAIIDALAIGADDVVSKGEGHDVLRARASAQIRRKRIADEARAGRERLLLAETRAALADQLELANRDLVAANRELEAFSASVSHDLRAPLRAIRSFTQMLEEDAGPALDERSRGHLARVIAATGRMSELIEALLDLARVSRLDLVRAPVDLTSVAATVVGELRARDPARVVDVAIAPELRASGDARLVRVLFDNLLGNAWKFTSTRGRATIAVGRDTGDDRAFFVRDDGVGFDMAAAQKLFTPFQRMHGSEIPGTGIGLATVRRIIERHRGRVWLESAVDRGTTVFFTLA
ncbi:MAG TPA: response regulator [Kofleriaceae bacterium]